MRSFNSSEALTEDKWQHVAVTVDASRGELVFYLNKRRMDKIDIGETKMLSNTQDILIGKGGDNYFGGYLDDIRVYDRILSANDVDKLYATSTDSGLIAKYGFENYNFNTGIVFDESSKGLDAEIVNKTATRTDMLVSNIGETAVDGTAFKNEIDTYMRVGSSDSIQGESINACTFSAWVKLPVTTGYQPIITKNGVFEFGVLDGRVNMRLGDGNSMHTLPKITDPQHTLQELQNSMTDNDANVLSMRIESGSALETHVNTISNEFSQNSLRYLSNIRARGITWGLESKSMYDLSGSYSFNRVDADSSTANKFVVNGNNGESSASMIFVDTNSAVEVARWGAGTISEPYWFLRAGINNEWPSWMLGSAPLTTIVRFKLKNSSEINNLGFSIILGEGEGDEGQGIQTYNNSMHHNHHISATIEGTATAFLVNAVVQNGVGGNTRTVATQHTGNINTFYLTEWNYLLISHDPTITKTRVYINETLACEMNTVTVFPEHKRTKLRIGPLAYNGDKVINKGAVFDMFEIIDRPLDQEAVKDYITKRMMVHTLKHAIPSSGAKGIFEFEKNGSVKTNTVQENGLSMSGDANYTSDAYNSGGALRMDSENGIVSLDTSNMESFDTFTYGAWIKADTVEGYQPLLVKNNIENNFKLGIQDGHVRVQINNSAPPLIVDMSAEIVSNGVHLRASVSDSTGGTAKAFLIDKPYDPTNAQHMKDLTDFVNSYGNQLNTYVLQPDHTVMYIDTVITNYRIGLTEELAPADGLNNMYAVIWAIDNNDRVSASVVATEVKATATSGRKTSLVLYDNSVYPVTSYPSDDPDYTDWYLVTNYFHGRNTNRVDTPRGTIERGVSADGERGIGFPSNPIPFKDENGEYPALDASGEDYVAKPDSLEMGGGWGHADNELFDALVTHLGGTRALSELWYRGRTDSHNRVMDFTTSWNLLTYSLRHGFNVLDPFNTFPESMYTLNEDHSTQLPASTNDFTGDRANDTAVYSPFFGSSLFVYQGSSDQNRWVVDENTGNNGTHFQTWVRGFKALEGRGMTPMLLSDNTADNKANASVVGGVNGEPYTNILKDGSEVRHSSYYDATRKVSNLFSHSVADTNNNCYGQGDEWSAIYTFPKGTAKEVVSMTFYQEITYHTKSIKIFYTDDMEADFDSESWIEVEKPSATEHYYNTARAPLVIAFKPVVTKRVMITLGKWHASHTYFGLTEWKIHGFDLSPSNSKIGVISDTSDRNIQHNTAPVQFVTQTKDGVTTPRTAYRITDTDHPIYTLFMDRIARHRGASKAYNSNDSTIRAVLSNGDTIHYNCRYSYTHNAGWTVYDASNAFGEESMIDTVRRTNFNTAHPYNWTFPYIDNGPRIGMMIYEFKNKVLHDVHGVRIRGIRGNTALDGVLRVFLLADDLNGKMKFIEYGDGVVTFNKLHTDKYTEVRFDPPLPPSHTLMFEFVSTVNAADTGISRLQILGCPAPSTRKLSATSATVRRSDDGDMQIDLNYNYPHNELNLYMYGYSFPNNGPAAYLKATHTLPRGINRSTSVIAHGVVDPTGNTVSTKNINYATFYLVIEDPSTGERRRFPPTEFRTTGTNAPFVNVSAKYSSLVGGVEVSSTTYSAYADITTLYVSMFTQDVADKTSATIAAFVKANASSDAVRTISGVNPSYAVLQHTATLTKAFTDVNGAVVQANKDEVQSYCPVVVAIDAEGRTSVGFASNSTVAYHQPINMAWSAGHNANGQLGYGYADGGNRGLTVCTAFNTFIDDQKAKGSLVVDFVKGGSHAIFWVKTTDGLDELYGLGYSDRGSLGVAPRGIVTQVIRCDLPSDFLRQSKLSIEQITTHDMATVLLLSDGKVYGFGRRYQDRGGFANGVLDATDATVPEMTEFVVINEFVASKKLTIRRVWGASHATFFYCSDNKVYGVGYNNDGIFLNGNSTSHKHQTPAELVRLNDVLANGYEDIVRVSEQNEACAVLLRTTSGEEEWWGWGKSRHNTTLGWSGANDHYPHRLVNLEAKIATFADPTQYTLSRGMNAWSGYCVIDIVGQKLWGIGYYGHCGLSDYSGYTNFYSWTGSNYNGAMFLNCRMDTWGFTLVSVEEYNSTKYPYVKKNGAMVSVESSDVQDSVSNFSALFDPKIGLNVGLTIDGTETTGNTEYYVGAAAQRLSATDVQLLLDNGDATWMLSASVPNDETIQFDSLLIPLAYVSSSYKVDPRGLKSVHAFVYVKRGTQLAFETVSVELDTPSLEHVAVANAQFQAFGEKLRTTVVADQRLQSGDPVTRFHVAAIKDDGSAAMSNSETISVMQHLLKSDHVKTVQASASYANGVRVGTADLSHMLSATKPAIDAVALESVTERITVSNNTYANNSKTSTTVAPADLPFHYHAEYDKTTTNFNMWTLDNGDKVWTFTDGAKCFDGDINTDTAAMATMENTSTGHNATVNGKEYTDIYTWWFYYEFAEETVVNALRVHNGAQDGAEFLREVAVWEPTKRYFRNLTQEVETPLSAETEMVPFEEVTCGPNKPLLIAFRRQGTTMKLRELEFVNVITPPLNSVPTLFTHLRINSVLSDAVSASSVTENSIGQLTVNNMPIPTVVSGPSNSEDIMTLGTIFTAAASTTSVHFEYSRGLPSEGSVFISGSSKPSSWYGVQLEVSIDGVTWVPMLHVTNLSSSESRTVPFALLPSSIHLTSSNIAASARVIAIAETVGGRMLAAVPHVPPKVDNEGGDAVQIHSSTIVPVVQQIVRLYVKDGAVSFSAELAASADAAFTQYVVAATSDMSMDVIAELQNGGFASDQILASGTLLRDEQLKLNDVPLPKVRDAANNNVASSGAASIRLVAVLTDVFGNVASTEDVMGPAYNAPWATFANFKISSEIPLATDGIESVGEFGEVISWIFNTVPSDDEEAQAMSYARFVSDTYKSDEYRIEDPTGSLQFSTTSFTAEGYLDGDWVGGNKSSGMSLASAPFPLMNSAQDFTVFLHMNFVFKSAHGQWYFAIGDCFPSPFGQNALVLNTTTGLPLTWEYNPSNVGVSGVSMAAPGSWTSGVDQQHAVVYESATSTFKFYYKLSDGASVSVITKQQDLFSSSDTFSFIINRELDLRNDHHWKKLLFFDSALGDAQVRALFDNESTQTFGGRSSKLICNMDMHLSTETVDASIASYKAILVDAVPSAFALPNGELRWQSPYPSVATPARALQGDFDALTVSALVQTVPSAEQVVATQSDQFHLKVRADATVEMRYTRQLENGALETNVLETTDAVTAGTRLTATASGARAGLYFDHEQVASVTHVSAAGGGSSSGVWHPNHTSYQIEKMMSAGYNNAGQMAQGHTSQTNFANAVRLDDFIAANPGIRILDVKGGGHHTVFVTKMGSDPCKIYSIGNNGNLELGDGTSTNRQSVTESTTLNTYVTDNNTDIVQVECGWNSTSVLLANGQIIGVGNNSYNGMCDGTTNVATTTPRVATQVDAHCEANKVKVKAIAYAGHNLIVYFDDNTVYSNYLNRNGIFGNGSTTNTAANYLQFLPMQALNTKLADEGFTIEYMQGQYDSLLLKLKKTDGTFEWWGVGANYQGWLGLGHASVANTLQRAVRYEELFYTGYNGNQPITDYVMGHGGFYGGMVIVDKTNRKVWSWGYFDHMGQISNDRTTPADRTSQWVNSIGEANVFEYTTNIAYTGRGVLFGYMLEGNEAEIFNPKPSGGSGNISRIVLAPSTAPVQLTATTDILETRMYEGDVGDEGVVLLSRRVSPDLLSLVDTLHPDAAVPRTVDRGVVSTVPLSFSNFFDTSNSNAKRPIANDTVYTAIVKVTDTAGTTSVATSAFSAEDPTISLRALEIETVEAEYTEGGSGGGGSGVFASTEFTKGMSSGYNNEYQMGNGDTSQNNFRNTQRLDALLAANPGMKAVRIQGGGHHTMLLVETAEGVLKLYGLGHNSHAEIGASNSSHQSSFIESTQFNQYATDNNTAIKMIAVGWHFTSVLYENGDIRSLGQGHVNQLLNGNTTNPQTTIKEPTLITAHMTATGVKPVSIFASSYNLIVHFDDNTFYTGGYNGNGILTNGNTTNQSYSQLYPITQLNAKMAEGYTLEMFQGRMSAWHVKLRNSSTGEFEWYGAGGNNSNHMMVSGAQTNMIRLTALENFMKGFAGDHVNGHGMDYGKMVVIDKVERKVWSWGYYDHVGQISNDKSAVPVDRTSQWVGAIGEANVFNATQVSFNGHGVWFMYVEDGYTPQTWFAGGSTGAGVKVSSTVKGSPDAPSTLYTLLTTEQSVGADTIRADVQSGSSSLPLFKVYVSPNEGSVTLDAVMRRVHTTDGTIVNINDVNAFYAHSYLAGPNESEAYKKADTQILMNGTTDANAPYVYIKNVRYDHNTEELYADAAVFSSQASIKECKMIPFLTRNVGDIPAEAAGYTISNATSLNGPSSGYLHINTNTGVRATTEWTLPTTESFSYSGWFKVGRGLSGQSGYLFFRHTLGSYLISNPYNASNFTLRTYNGLYNSSTSPNIGLIDRSLNTDTWYHVARSYRTEDGGATYTVAIYVNGVPMNFANNNTGTLQQLIDTSNEDYNGSSGKYLMETNIDNNRFTRQTADTHVEMFLSNFAVWNAHALTPSEVAALYAEGFMGSASNTLLQSADHLFPFNDNLLDKGPSQLVMNAVYRDDAGNVVDVPETDGRMEFVKPDITGANAPLTLTFSMKTSVILPKTLEVGLFYTLASTWDMYAFEDNTEIYKIENGAKTTLLTTLSRYQSYSTSATVDEGIVSSSPLAYKYTTAEVKQTHHLHVRGKVFVSHTRGYTDQVIILTLHPNTTIKYQTDAEKAQVTEVIADAYTQFIFRATSTSVSWPWTIESDQDVCVTNCDGNVSDSYVVYPASREIFGTVPGGAQVYAWDSANPTTAPTSYSIQAQASWTTTATSKAMSAHGFTNPFSAQQAHTGGFTRCYLEESVPSTIYISGIQYGDGDGGCASCYIPREYLSTKILTSTSQYSTTLANVLCGIQFESGLPSTFDKSTVTYSTSGAGSVSNTASTNFNAANTQQDGVTLMHYNLGTNISNQLYESSNTYMFVLVNHGDNEEVLLGNTPLLSNGAGGDPTPSPLVLGDTLTLRAFVTDANDAVSFNDRFHTLVDYQTVVSAAFDSSGNVSVMIDNTTATKTTVIASDKALPIDRVLNLMKLAPSAEEEGALAEAKSNSAVLSRCMLSDLSPNEAVSKPISTFTDLVIYVLSSDESLTKILTENAAYEIQSIVMSDTKPALSSPTVVNATSSDLRVKVDGLSTMFSSNAVPTTNVYSYDVSVLNMQYVLSSASETTPAPALEGALRFFVGDTVVFNMVDAPNHPLYFTTALNSPMNGMGSAATVTNNGAVSGAISVEFLEAGTFYYQCGNHSQMYRTIEIVTSVDVSDNELYVFAMRLAPDVPLTRKRSVTVASGQYMVNNAPNAEIVMYIGDTLELNADVSGHPLWIKSVRSRGTSDAVEGVENNGSVSGTIRWQPTYHGEYYYNCQFHGSMSGVIHVLERVLRSNFTTNSLYTSVSNLLEHAPTHTNGVHADVLYKQSVANSGERIEHVFSDLSFGSALGDYNGYPIPIQAGDKLAIVCMGVQDSMTRVHYEYTTSPVYFDLSEFSPTSVTKSEFSVSDTLTEFTYTFGANSTVIQFKNDLQFDTYYDFDIVPSGSGSGSSHPYMMSFSIFATQGECGGREADGVNTAETPKSGKYVGGNVIHYYNSTTGTLTVFGVNAGNNLSYNAEYMSTHYVRVIVSEDTFTVLLFDDEKRTSLKTYGNLTIPPSSRMDYSNTLNSQSPYNLAFGFRENGTTNFSGNKITIKNIKRHN